MSSGKKKFLKPAAIGFVVALVLVVACGAAYSQMETAEFCGNCHAMTENYVTWHDSAHGSIACGECHLPHDNVVSTLWAKTKTGVVDVVQQTTGNYDLTIHTTEEGQKYLQDNCVRCHESAIRETGMGSVKDGDGRQCTSCHRNLVHNDMTINISQ